MDYSFSGQRGGLPKEGRRPSQASLFLPPVPASFPQTPTLLVAETSSRNFITS